MKYLTVILFVGAIFYSCNNDSFEKHKNGLEYKKIKEASGDAKRINVGDVVELNLKYSNEKDSVLFNSREFTNSFKMEVKPSSHKGGSFEDALKMMRVGDKFEFLILADSFFIKTKNEKTPKELNPSSKLKFEVEILRIVDSAEIARERSLQEKIMKKQEQVALNQYIKDKNITQKPTKSGLYYIETKKGKGNKLSKGDTLEVHYTGKFLNGEVFDSSYDRNEAFTFVLGDKNIIEAWNEGFSYMKKGGEATFIIPSNLAYGKKGFSTIIPPFCSLVFDVKLIR